MALVPKGMMIRRGALGGVLVALLAIGAAYASAFASGGAPGWAPWAMAVGTTLLMVSTTALGAVRAGRLGRIWVPLAAMLLLMGGGFCLALAMPGGETVESSLWLGLPRRAAVILFGVGLLPLFFVPVSYALTFDATTLSEADLARVRSLAAGVREES
jgi:hypothetical protein